MSRAFDNLAALQLGGEEGDAEPFHLQDPFDERSRPHFHGKYMQQVY
jgi:hypothetical protein